MKKYSLIILAALISVGTMSGCVRKPAEEPAPSDVKTVSRLVSDYSSTPGFEVVNVGGLGLSIVKALVRRSGDEEALQVLDAIKKVTRVTVTTYEDCEKSVREEFAGKLGELLDNETLLFEAKDSGDKVQIFGQTSEDGDSVSDIVVNVPEDGTLICIEGLIPMDKIAEILENNVR